MDNCTALLLHVAFCMNVGVGMDIGWYLMEHNAKVGAIITLMLSLLLNVRYLPTDKFTTTCGTQFVVTFVGLNFL